MHARSGCSFALALTLCLAAPAARAQHYYLPRELLSPEAGLDTFFGEGLDVNDLYIAVGASREVGGAIYRQGRVYLYRTDTGLIADEITDPSPSQNGDFGHSVAMTGGLILIGAPIDSSVLDATGAVYLYDVFSGTQLDRFSPPGAHAGDHVGECVAVRGVNAVVGAPNDDEDEIGSGAIYGYRADLMTQVFKLKPDAPVPGERFGTSVALDDDIIVVGAPGGVDSPNAAGAVYVFSIQTGEQLRRFTPPTPAPGDRFGQSVALSEGVLAVGSWGCDDAGHNAGAVYLFDPVMGTPLATIYAPDPQPDQDFGISRAMGTGGLVVGADRRDAGGADTGAVFVYDLGTGDIDEAPPGSGAPGQLFGGRVAVGQGGIVASGLGAPGVRPYAAQLRAFCDPDLDANGLLDFFDISTFINDEVDFNHDGVFNFFDVSAFLVDFNAGCPE